MESLSVPMVQEVVVLADLGCNKCKERIAKIITKLDCGETQSVVISVREKMVTLICKSRGDGDGDSEERRRRRPIRGDFLISRLFPFCCFFSPS
ncbi:hypothetical protein M569_16699 [Genlisea aurea]|uniref:HMA domain-containing protein n=1 Tax=Genlisea aurea TaxID=192259 RepID=S8D636_9LAMI|nr:hypothetical protein M569_16699 [Genlisea aurea]